MTLCHLYCEHMFAQHHSKIPSIQQFFQGEQTSIDVLTSIGAFEAGLQCLGRSKIGEK